jgi:uncharacterized damage-inducible protein DinB
MIPSIQGVLDRDLRALIRGIEAYPDDASVWREIPGITNSGGTLALHLAGNLRHFLGSVLGGTSYVRDREAEFARRGVTRAELVAEVERARKDIAAGLGTLSPKELDRPYAQPIAGVTVTLSDTLVHLASHLAYHLGQVDYHRRIATGQNRGVGAIAASELPSARPAG